MLENQSWEPPCGQRVAILIVEDDRDDAILLKHVLDSARIRADFRVVSDGDQAVAYLEGRGQYADRDRFPSPFCVFLDLQMPRMPGFHVLSWIKCRPQTRDLPVIVLTGAGQLGDAKRAYQLGAFSFLEKPINQEDLLNVFRSLKSVSIQVTNQGYELCAVAGGR